MNEKDGTGFIYTSTPGFSVTNTGEMRKYTSEGKLFVPGPEAVKKVINEIANKFIFKKKNKKDCSTPKRFKNIFLLLFNDIRFKGVSSFEFNGKFTTKLFYHDIILNRVKYIEVTAPPQYAKEFPFIIAASIFFGADSENISKRINEADPFYSGGFKIEIR